MSGTGAAAALPELVCGRCGRRYPAADLAWQCDCGSVLDVVPFGSALPGRDELARRPATLWRYAEVLPVPELDGVGMGEGFTPLVPAPLSGVRLKVEYHGPTQSFKDRGAVMLATLARVLGVRRLIADSSGNAGCALAAYAARIGVECEIYVPASTSPGKLVQMRAYGATVKLVEGRREDAATAAKTAAKAPDACYASHMFHPYFLHGTKTFAYELWEQSGGRLPDTVVLPVGHGTLLLGTCLGFAELVERGLADRVPVVIGVQAGNCAPLAVAAAAGADQPAEIEPLPTRAEGIAIAKPARGPQILAGVRGTGGTIVSVSDDQVLEARADLARGGFFVEPTAAVCWAAVRAARESRPEGVASALVADDVVVPLSGAGLKSP